MDIEKIKSIAMKASYKELYDSLKKNKIQDPGIIRELIAVAGYQDFRFFVRYFFDAHCRFPFSGMHEDFFKDEQQVEKRGRREVIAAPRGHAKTTFKVHFKVCHALIYGYEPYILIVCQSAIEAKERVTKIFEELQTNQKIREVFGLLLTEGGRAGAKRSFLAQNGTKVEGLSIGQQIRGKSHLQYRPSMIILDDVETLESAYSPLQRAKLKDWLNKDVLKCAQTDGSSNITVIGTCIHTESLLSGLLHTPGWMARKYQAVTQFNNNEFLWQEWRRIYTDLANSQREVEAEQFFQANQAEMLHDTEVLWPEVESYLDLMKQIVTEGEAAFQSEKQNDPYDPERQLFNLDQARYFQLDWEKQEIIWLDGSKKVVILSNLKRILAFHDMAMGANPNQATTDYAAIVVVGEDQDGYHYVLDCYLEKSLPNTQIEQGFRLHEQWNLYGLYIEENGAQKLLLSMYEDQRERFPQAKNLIIRGVHQTGDKIRRISTLQPDINNGQLLFRQDLNPRFFSQLRLFPTTLHDDGPDALQGAVFQLKELSRKQIISNGVRTTGYSRSHNRYAPLSRDRR